MGDCEAPSKYDSNHRRMLLNAERLRQFLLFPTEVVCGGVPWPEEICRKRMKRCQSGCVGLLLLCASTSLPEELLRKAEEELAHVAAVGSNEESVMADDKLNRGSRTAAGLT